MGGVRSLPLISDCDREKPRGDFDKVREAGRREVKREVGGEGVGDREAGIDLPRVRDRDYFVGRQRVRGVRHRFFIVHVSLALARAPPIGWR